MYWWGTGAAVLIHCGAGVSRSATLCIAYLMRKLSWTAEKARAHCKLRRSLTNPNDGFWRSLCALEVALGLAERLLPHLPPRTNDSAWPSCYGPSSPAPRK
jgi:protein-tyrosine phosphatase